MSEDIETTINAEDGVRVYVSEWDDGGAWLRLSARGGSMYTSLTREQAQELLVGLQNILAREVPA
jgi:hypothetical protein